MYKVLDVREYDELGKGTNYRCGTMLIQKTHYVVAICEEPVCSYSAINHFPSLTTGYLIIWP